VRFANCQPGRFDRLMRQVDSVRAPRHRARGDSLANNLLAFVYLTDKGRR